MLRRHCVVRPSSSWHLPGAARWAATTPSPPPPSPRPRPTVRSAARSCSSPTSRSTCPRSWSRPFEAESGIDLVTRAAGDGGTLTAKLSLTKDNPTGDLAFGVDNTFASRPLDEGVFATYEPTLPAGRRRTTPSTRVPTSSPRSTSATSASTSTRPGSRRRASSRPRRSSDLADPTYAGPVRHPRRLDQLGRDVLPAQHDRGVRRRRGRPTGRTCSTTAPRSSTAGRTPTTATSPRAAARAPARSSCPTTPRRPSPSRTASRRPRRAARHLLPPGRVRRRPGRRREPRRCAGRHRLAALRRGPGRVADRDVRLPRERRASRCRPTGRRTPSSRRRRCRCSPADIAANREQWLSEWTDVVTR